MVQVENEYGSYAADKEYLTAIRDMLQEAGFNVPLFTCDGGGQVEAGHIDGALPTLNGVFGEDIFKIVKQNLPLDKTAETLVDTANSNGGKDNISVILIKP